MTNLALTAGRLCVRDEDLDSARVALQKAAELIERLKATTESKEAAGLSGTRRLEAEYLAMRTLLVRFCLPGILASRR